MQDHNSWNRRELFRGAGVAAGAALAVQSKAQTVKYNRGQTVKIGVVGGGFGSGFQWHLDPDCSVVAVCDIRPDRLQRLQETYRCDNAYNQFRGLLKHPGLNAVAVFTPAPMHVWMAVEAMKAGKHVISAVPAGMSIEELEELLDVVKENRPEVHDG